MTDTYFIDGDLMDTGKDNAKYKINIKRTLGFAVYIQIRRLEVKH
jgi:hypothetical protein